MIYLKTFLLVLVLIITLSSIFALTSKHRDKGKDESRGGNKDEDACAECGIKEFIKCDKL
ncbi:MAG: hypothetical protein GXO88_10795 [Chlorobi bacterium]|nr:hypothetical protein [Chlorobiota bacterium]